MSRDRVLSKLDYESLKRLIEENPAHTVQEARAMSIIKEFFLRIKPINTRKVRPDVITMNSSFCLRDIGNGKKEVYSLVFPDQTDHGDNTISILSPLGMEVLGCRTGKVIKGSPYEEKYYLIEKVISQPDLTHHAVN